jgi:GT2 family glycosyltransferase
MNMNLKVSIIILNWNGLSDTIECLESLKKLTYPNYEIIVVDNGSRGNDADILDDRYKDVIKLIRSDRNCGFAGGNNLAIKWVLKNSYCDYFLLLNNDTVVHQEFLTELIKVAAGDAQIGIAGPKTYIHDFPDTIQLAWFEVDMRIGKAYHIGSLSIDKSQYDDVKQVNYLQGSCLLIKQKVIQEVGLLDDSFFCYWEETDFCLRVSRAGYKIAYVPKAKIWHKKSGALKPWYKSFIGRDRCTISRYESYLMTRNNFWFMKKHATKRQHCTFLLYFFTIRFWGITGLHLVYYRRPSGLAAFYRGVWDGLFESSHTQDMPK